MSTLFDLNPNELHYCPHMISLDGFNGSYNTLDNPSGRLCILNKTENANVNVFNMTTGIKESKAITKL